MKAGRAGIASRQVLPSSTLSGCQPRIIGGYSVSSYRSLGSSSLLRSRRCYTTHQQKAPHVCVVGAGPAGFYTIEYLLKNIPNVYIDLYERWPCPYGLVRFGVAPDHPEVKVVANKFEKFVTDNAPRVQFVGNVNVGSAVTIEELKDHYNAIVLTYGSDVDRLLGVEGEKLRGVHSARDFVGWYNGEPPFATSQFDLSCESAVVIGQGNVALDVARILLSPLDVLAATDITPHALEALAKSKIKEVHIVGRRGPAQASFTNKELREILDLKGCKTILDPANVLELNPASQEEVKAERGKKRMMEMLKSKTAGQDGGPTDKKVYLHYLKSPLRFLSGQAKDALGAMEVEKNRLEGEPGNQRAIGTGEKQLIPCGIVFRSIGYKSVGIKGIPFDEAKGIIPNQRGRVVEYNKSEGAQVVVPGLYVSGWVKRGPSGVIGTNRMDAEETVALLCADLAEGKLPTLAHTYNNNNSHTSGRPLGLDGIRPIIASRGVSVVDWEAWKKIEAVEEARGKAKGAEREKLVSVEDMLSHAYRT